MYWYCIVKGVKEMEIDMEIDMEIEIEIVMKIDPTPNLRANLPQIHQI